MSWNRSELGLLAYASCATCRGTGVRKDDGQELIPCRCALRGAFRACYARFRGCVDAGKLKSRVSFERASRGINYRGSWGRKEEEYMADFELTARRALDGPHYKLFRFHFLLGADAKLCCRQLKIDRGLFYHAIYRIEEQLGQAMAELEPYALFPPRDYFAYRSPEGVQASVIRAPEPFRPRRGRPSVLSRLERISA